MAYGPNNRYAIPGGGGTAAQRSALQYPDPFYDVGQTKLPKSIKQLFSACQYAMTADPLVVAATSKMAQYPITPITIMGIDGATIDAAVKRSWEDILIGQLQIEMFQTEIGLDYYGYGNSIVSLVVPFKKFLTCRNKECQADFELTSLRPVKDWSFSQWRFKLTCPKCKQITKPLVEDRYIRSARNTRLKRWNVADIDIDYYPMSDEYVYRYTVPKSYRQKLLRGDVKAIATTPVEMLDCLLRGTKFRLSNANLFHFRPPRVVVGDDQMGWGFPPILPTLKDAHHIQLMKKAQEALLMEHIVPLRWISPANTSSVDVYRSVNLAQWQREVKGQIEKWRGDANHIPIFSLPLNVQMIGGQGKSLMLVPEIQELSKQRLAAMGVPVELVFGGMRWSSSSVSLRMMENVFMTYRLQHHRLLNRFIIPTLARVLGLPLVEGKMSPFKMGDDVQAKQLLVSLNATGKISDETLLTEFELDWRAEQERIDRENRVRAAVLLNQKLEEVHIQGEMQILQTMYARSATSYSQDAAGSEAKGQPQGATPGQPAQGKPQGQQATPSVDITGAKEKAQKNLAKSQKTDMRSLPAQKPPTRTGSQAVT